MSIYQMSKPDTSDADMIAMFKKALTKVAKLKLETICVDMSIKLETKAQSLATSFSFTVFNGAHDNRSFYFYSFWEKDFIEQGIKDLFELLKQDDFHKIKHAKVAA